MGPLCATRGRCGSGAGSGYDHAVQRHRHLEVIVRASRVALAALLALVGVVWLGQGVGLIGGSVMTGSAFWAAVGAILLALAVAVLLVERRRSGRA
jgi:hypothetical protein